MRHLLLATRNAHKTREFAAILGPEFTVSDLTLRADLPAVKETGSTLEENATLKAVAISRLVPGLVVADDSGLEVDALGGKPGVYSARYAGEHASDSDNIAKLLRELAASGTDGGAAAQFRSVLVLAQLGNVMGVFHGVVRGTITQKAAGTRGFGYDPIFKPDGSARTFAEIGDEVKNAISHRARAIAQLPSFLTESPPRGRVAAYEIGYGAGGGGGGATVPGAP